MLNKYKNWLIVNGNSEATISAYLQRIDHFLNAVTIETLDEEQIVNYLLSVKEKSSPSTVNGYRCAIKSFLSYIKKEVKLPKQLKIEQRLPEFITKEVFENEVAKVAECIFTKPLKVKAILYFMFFTGVRESEIATLQRKNIDLEKRTAKIYNKKGKSEKIVLFTERVRDIISQYFSVENEDTNAFNTSINSIKKTFQKLKPYFKNVNLHAHMFRHSYATHLRSKGFSIEDIKELLGHKSIQSTMRYAHADINKIKEKYDKKIK